jgi:hypothetical protein
LYGFPHWKGRSGHTVHNGKVDLDLFPTMEIRVFSIWNLKGLDILSIMESWVWIFSHNGSQRVFLTEFKVWKYSTMEKGIFCSGRKDRPKFKAK